MVNNIHGFLITTPFEKERASQVELLQRQLPQLKYIEAIYPSRSKIPFKKKLLAKSFQRTGHALSDGELGCLLSHRKVWSIIANSAKNPDQLYLILESDSAIISMEKLVQEFEHMAQQFDLFFWGAWEGHMQLHRSTIQKRENGFVYGVPLLKSVYCTYGYALNKRAALLLLERTKKIAYPVDQFKKMIRPNELRLGGTRPEIISTIGKRQSYIQTNRNHAKEFFTRILLDLKNSIICYFK